MFFSNCADDVSLGPQVVGCRDDFDFTVQFEQTFLSLVPAAIYIVLSLWRASQLRRKPIIVTAPHLQLAKVVSCVMIFGRVYLQDEDLA